LRAADEDNEVSWCEFVEHVERALEKIPSSRYFAKDDGGEEVDLGEHADMEAAKLEAWANWRTNFEHGDLPRSIVDVYVWAEDEPEIRECVEVEVGDDPEEPPCSHEDGHEWALRGSFPRWQLADGRTQTDEECIHCGRLRLSHTASPAGQLPQYPERIEYPEPLGEER
jgi:hypothetical protein